MNIKILDKNGVTLKTKGKYCTEDISVAVDDSLMGITPTGTYQVTNNGEYDITEYAKVNVNVASSGGGNTLKKLLDFTGSCYRMFANKTTTTDFSDYISYNDTENCTITPYMFQNCTALTTAPLLDMNRLNNTSYMFSGCTALTTVPVIKILKVDANISYMFQNCTALTTIPSLILTDQINMSNAFNGCSKLVSVDISLWSNYNGDYSANMFKNCYSLKTVIIRSVGSSKSLSSSAFTNCYHLTGTVNATYNPDGLKDAYIYVPRSMVDTLKSYTNWATYADQIRALEDYTVDGTTTGELDESKI